MDRRFVDVGVGALAVVLIGCGGQVESAGPGTDEASSGAAAQQALADLASEEDWVQLPGVKAHKSCAFEVPAEAEISGEEIKLNGRTLSRIGRCAHQRKRVDRAAVNPPTVNGEVEYVVVPVPTNAAGYDWANEVSSDWKVPRLPSQTGGLVYLWNGLEDADNTGVLQTVLQYGNNGLFGGNSWVLVSVYGGPMFGGNYFYSTPINVSPDDLISGYSYTFASTPEDARWRITGVDRTKNTSTSIATYVPLPLTYAFAGSLEAWHLTSCNQYWLGSSSYTVFSSVAVFEHGLTPSSFVQVPMTGSCASGGGDPCWSPVVLGGSPSCHYSANATSSTATLFY